MGSNPLWQQLKANLIFILAAMLVLGLIVVGFAFAGALLLFFAVVYAIVKIRIWWISQRVEGFKKNRSSFEVDDFIDAKFEIIEQRDEETKGKKKG